jgi:biotin synthase
VVKKEMASRTIKILSQHAFSKDDIAYLLNTKSEEQKLLFRKATEIKEKYVGNKVWLRGLIELSNICSKNCYYCGIRKENSKVCRYEIKTDEVIESAKFAFDNGFGSLVIQSGEIQSAKFTNKILDILQKIQQLSNPKLRVTLSCGEQSEETYKSWFEAGAERYLLRIETSNPELYRKIHPNDSLHDFDKRIEALKTLKKIGFQTGTGVMIGLPFQTIDDLANDILFMKKMDIHMCGMGPYIEHSETPLFKYSDSLLTLRKRYELALKMIAILRIVMKDINIASTTAFQTIDSEGKKSALEIGANVLMPNLTPSIYKANYNLYNNKPGKENSVDYEFNLALKMIHNAGNIVGLNEYGDSRHYSPL